MAGLANLEKLLSDVFVKKAPPLPANGKKTLVEYLPWVTLVFGLLALWAVYVLWQWAHTVNGLVDYANSLSATYGSPAVEVSRMTFMVWVGLAALLAQAVLYVAAFTPLKDRKKSGWNLLFYAALFNVLYGVAVLFTDYGGFGQLLPSLVGSAIGLYLLFQIRDAYTTQKTVTPTKA